MDVDIETREIEREWRRMIFDRPGLWKLASAEMKKFQRIGCGEDQAALRAMRKVGWLKVVSVQDQAAEEYDEIIRAQDMVEGK